MKILLYSLLILLLIPFVSCERNNERSGFPDCVTEKINQLQKEDCPSVGSVEEYLFMGETVYVIHPKNCGADLTSEVVDENCQSLCFLGGITGNTKCKDLNFFEEAKLKKQIYP